jgi:hypothetical protein
MVNKVYRFKGKPYLFVAQSKIKLSGLVDAGYVFTDDVPEELPDWVDVVIYKCLYDNPDGEIWVREASQFYKLFELSNGE